MGVEATTLRLRDQTTTYDAVPQLARTHRGADAAAQPTAHPTSTPSTHACSSNSSTAATAAPAASTPGQVYSNTTLPDSLGLSHLIVSTFYPNFKIRSHGLHFMGVEATTLCLRDQITRAR